MKKALLFGLITATMLSSDSASGQGGIVIGNYRAPYNQVLWSWGLPVSPSDGVQLTLWYGEGILSADQLTESLSLSWNLPAYAAGYAGYYNHVPVMLPGWSPGETYTFQVRASGSTAYGEVDPRLARSILWYERDDIEFIGGEPPGVPGVSQQSIGLVLVPEPTSVALLSAGLAGLALTRRGRERPSVSSTALV